MPLTQRLTSFGRKHGIATAGGHSTAVPLLTPVTARSGSWCAQVVEVDDAGGSISLNKHVFKFDRVFDQASTQEDVFDYLRCGIVNCSCNAAAYLHASPDRGCMPPLGLVLS